MKRTFDLLWLSWGVTTIAVIILSVKCLALVSQNQKLQAELNWWRCERQHQLPAEPVEVK